MNEKRIEVRDPEDTRTVEEFLYNAGKEAQRDADTRIIRDQFGQEYLVSGRDVLCEVKEKHDHITQPALITLSTLDGLVDYINNDPDMIFHNPETRYQVIVNSPTEVLVISPYAGYYKERSTIIRCAADVPQVAFGCFMDTEKFQVLLQTCFLETENLKLVLKLAGSVRKEQNLQTADDGVSQKVTINSGVTTAADVIVKNPVELVPFRTFVEIEQPASPFVLRFNQDGDAALFTGAGKSWVVEAKMSIVAYLEQKLVDSDANVFVVS